MNVMISLIELLESIETIVHAERLPYKVGLCGGGGNADAWTLRLRGQVLDTSTARQIQCPAKAYSPGLSARRETIIVVTLSTTALHHSTSLYLILHRFYFS